MAGAVLLRGAIPRLVDTSAGVLPLRDLGVGGAEEPQAVAAGVACPLAAMELPAGGTQSSLGDLLVAVLAEAHFAAAATAADAAGVEVAAVTVAVAAVVGALAEALGQAVKRIRVLAPGGQDGSCSGGSGIVSLPLPLPLPNRAVVLEGGGVVEGGHLIVQVPGLAEGQEAGQHHDHQQELSVEMASGGLTALVAPPPAAEIL